MSMETFDEEELPPDVTPWHADLNDRQRRFVEEYAADYNATQAAVRSGFSDKESSSAVIGSRLLRNVKVRKAIDAFLDLHSMTTGEALQRLTDMARGSVEPFIETYGRGFKLDLSSDAAKASLHLIKEIGSTANGPYIKLHDAKDAVKTILQVRGKLINKTELTGADGGPIKTEPDYANMTDEQLYAIIARKSSPADS